MTLFSGRPHETWALGEGAQERTDMNVRPCVRTAVERHMLHDPGRCAGCIHLLDCRKNSILHVVFPARRYLYHKFLSEAICVVSRALSARPDTVFLESGYQSADVKDQRLENRRGRCCSGDHTKRGLFGRLTRTKLSSRYYFSGG